MVEAFLAELTAEERAELQELGSVRRYKRGDVLFHQGDDAGAVLVIRAGHVKAAMLSDGREVILAFPGPGELLGELSAVDGQPRSGTVRAVDDAGAVLVILAGHVKAAMLSDGREVILAFPGPGELLGELSAVDGQPRSGTVRAVDDVEALVIPGSAFRAVLEHRPRIAFVLLRSVIERLRTADRQRVDYAVNDVCVRVAGRLVELCDRFGAQDGAVIDIGLAITQDELASWAGASREAVAKAMGLLRTLGWVQTERRRILVLDLPALRRYAA